MALATVRARNVHAVINDTNAHCVNGQYILDQLYLRCGHFMIPIFF